jgi:hypothetical protein
MEGRPVKPFETSIYEKDPEKPGYLRFLRMATYQELFDYCDKVLRSSGIHDELEYFDLMQHKSADLPLPRHLKWLAVFAVTGGSEGHYVHVEIIYQGEDIRKGYERECVLLAKDLGGKFDTALKVVSLLTPLLS